MPDRSLFISRLDNTASRLTVTPTQIRIALARNDPHEKQIISAAPLIAEKVAGDLTRRGTFHMTHKGLSIHMTTRSPRNNVPGQKFTIREGALV